MYVMQQGGGATEAYIAGNAPHGDALY
eukprot:SAG11_NODE_23840_length_382_cov_1.102473_1_plen_26_part_10